MPVYIGVVGPDPAPEPVSRQAEEVGRLLASAGAVLVCGGLGGVMEAAARGAAAKGGTSIGLLPGPSRGAANAHLTISIPTGMGEMRNVLVVRASDAVIALAGEFGTLSEIAFALKTGVPVVGLETWELAKAGKRVEPFVLAGSPEEAVREALRLAEEASRNGTP
ncbi:MAG TPA: TIGR00725 family protein [Actinomycetota bacterium]|nr:TIGR00725 family protein [Actinomycetota bacterium]